MATGDAIEMAHGDLTKEILGAFYHLHTYFGYGFMESVYQRAMPVALAERGIASELEVAYPVFYNDVRVGNYRADLVVEGKVFIEIKCAERIARSHTAQLRNYLKASQISVGLLLNFGPRAEIRRLIL